MPPITLRDFLNGTALTIAAGLTPAAQLAAQPARYPPALIGLRGQHVGSFEIAHALAREGRKFPIDGLPIDERYDLVVVGAGTAPSLRFSRKSESAVLPQRGSTGAPIRPLAS